MERYVSHIVLYLNISYVLTIKIAVNYAAITKCIFTISHIEFRPRVFEKVPNGNFVTFAYPTNYYRASSVVTEVTNTKVN